MTTHCTKCGGKISVGISTKWPNAKVCDPCARCAIDKLAETDGGDMTEQKTTSNEPCCSGYPNCKCLVVGPSDYSYETVRGLVDCRDRRITDLEAGLSSLQTRLREVEVDRDEVLAKLQEAVALGSTQAEAYDKELITLESTNQQLRARVEAAENLAENSQGVSKHFEGRCEELKAELARVKQENDSLYAYKTVRGSHLEIENERFEAENERLKGFLKTETAMVGHHLNLQLKAQAELEAVRKELDEANKGLAKLKCSECGGTDSVCGTAWLKDKERLEAENTALKAKVEQLKGEAEVRAHISQERFDEVAKLRKVAEMVSKQFTCQGCGHTANLMGVAETLANLEEGKDGR